MTFKNGHSNQMQVKRMSVLRTRCSSILKVPWLPFLRFLWRLVPTWLGYLAPPNWMRSLLVCDGRLQLLDIRRLPGIRGICEGKRWQQGNNGSECE